VAVPVMLLLLLLGPALLPEYRDPNAGRLDLVSVAQSLAAVLSSIYALKQFAEHGLAWDSVLLMFAGVEFGVMFVRRQGRLAYPLLDMTLFRQSKFSAAIAAYGLSSLAMFGVYIFINQYLQLVLGLSPLRAGLTTLPWALAFVVGSLVTPRLTRRWSPVSILVWGLVVSALGFAMLALVDGAYAIELMVVSTVVMSAGLAPVLTVGNEMIITAAPPERAGAASAISETCAEFSGALGIAVFGSLGTVLYRHALGSALPQSVPEATAADAMSTIGGAMAAAATLPPELGTMLRESAGAAFTNALQFNAAAGAAVILAASAVAARILRARTGPGPKQAQETS
jgi:DHA2 family multidrug resistance protein-like MFS transporter